jgi:glutathione S-transferase
MYIAMIIYYKPTCPFCRRVMAVVDRLGVEVEWRDIVAQPDFAEELVARGGKQQVPYLVDESAGVEMYESDAIVAYLQEKHGTPSTVATKPRVHISNSVCESCEG